MRWANWIAVRIRLDSHVASDRMIGLTMFSIGEFSRLGSVSVRSLRHYHDLGLLVPADVDRWATAGTRPPNFRSSTASSPSKNSASLWTRWAD